MPSDSRRLARERRAADPGLRRRAGHPSGRDLDRRRRPGDRVSEGGRRAVRAALRRSVIHGFEVVRGREVRDVRSELPGLDVRGAEVKAGPDARLDDLVERLLELENVRVAAPLEVHELLVIS